MHVEGSLMPIWAWGNSFGARLSQTLSHLLVYGFSASLTPFPKGHPHAALLVCCPAQHRGEALGEKLEYSGASGAIRAFVCFVLKTLMEGVNFLEDSVT